ncbi:hypothetical protein IEQ34_001645 [Dendrobium chrysotoxum]|uniref:DC1 domain-containing protein n=1 Tax=Dendrobium chrysotoxum TaxID=161865 RepID=A0AAV7HR08_DENCH|nr:hypothetical protein IEQ34_001645 [Dendrobium chrysotoxum]
MDDIKLALAPASTVPSATLISALTVQTQAPTPPFFLLRMFFFFQFLPYSPGDSPRYCNACGQDIGGFIYHCRKCGYDFHPYCAALPHVLNANGSLRHKTSAP